MAKKIVHKFDLWAYSEHKCDRGEFTSDKYGDVTCCINIGWKGVTCKACLKFKKSKKKVKNVRK